MPAEDYRLWYEFSRVTQLANLREPLLSYRVHPTQVSHVHSARRQSSANETRQRQLLDKGFVLSPAEWEQYIRILDRSTRPHTAQELEPLLATMWTIWHQNDRLGAYPAAWFETMFAAAWQDALIAIGHHGWGYVRPALLAPKPFPEPLNTVARLKFLTKCALAWRGTSAPVVSTTLPDA
jgi:hypothetical protein